MFRIKSRFKHLKKIKEEKTAKIVDFLLFLVFKNVVWKYHFKIFLNFLFSSLGR